MTSGVIHEAFLYADVDEFVGGMVPFIEAGRRADEPVQVAVTAANAAALRSALTGPLDGVTFVDIESAGRNPGRIISLWRDFLTEHNGNGGPVRGIGEPIWASRSPIELAECHNHELLLNLAFGTGPNWRLVCPYDVSALTDQVLEQARINHPIVLGSGGSATSPSYRPDYRHVLREPLPPPPAELAGQLAFELEDLPWVRRLVSALVAEAGVGPRKQADFITAVNEVATNSIRYGGGAGRLRLWWEADSLVAEVCDLGVIDSPLIGRQRPTAGPNGGYGLWLVHQLCDLVQLRSDAATGTVVRMYVRRGAG